MPQAAERFFPSPLPLGVDAPATAAAMSGPVADAIRASWMELASVHSETGEMLAFLSTQESLAYPYGGDPDAVAIVNTTAQAFFLEYGRAGFHLPSHWGNRGGKWKTGKNGKRYASVPFRHRTPFATGGGFTLGRRRSEMPAEVYSQASGLGNRGRLGGFGDLYKLSRPYDLMRHVIPDFPTDLPSSFTWASSKYEGLQRNSLPTPGGGTQTEYLTWRTITPDSPGWYIPPTPARHYAERALQQAAPAIQQMIDEAAALDLAAAVVAATVGLIS